MLSSSPAPADMPTGSGTLHAPIKRRSFFKYAGASASTTALILAGCKSKSSLDPVYVGTGDVGVLNYAYALEQLEAAFYTALRDGSYYKGLAADSAERLMLDDLYYHEIIHRDFLKTAITAANATPIKALTTDFGGIDFSSRVSVLRAAKTFEDLGVAAYNGAGRRITSPAYLLLASKIVSVEARHAALIRDLVTEGTFVDADIVLTTSTSTEIYRDPASVVVTANAYLVDGSKLDITGIQ